MNDSLSFLHITYYAAVFIAFVIALGLITFKYVNTNPPKNG